MTPYILLLLLWLLAAFISSGMALACAHHSGILHSVHAGRGTRYLRAAMGWVVVVATTSLCAGMLITYMLMAP